jgi:hypothetical protein
MSTNRAAALRYADQTRQLAIRRPQPMNYSKPTAVKHVAPEIAAARAELDDIADETRKDREIEDDKKDDYKARQVDSKDFSAPTPNPKRMTATSVNTSSVQPTELNSVYRNCWTISSTIVIPPEIHDAKSQYTPNFISLFETLNAMERLLYNNEELKYVARAYFSLPIRLYYAVIAHYTIYRAKETTGTLSKSEGSWLRAIRRTYPEESLPIASPLIPILQNIAGHKPDDAQFAYVYPAVPPTGTYKATPDSTKSKQTTLEVHPQHYLIPSVAMLGSMLRIFCTLPAITDSYFDANHNFVPFDVSEGGEFAGIYWPALPNTGYTHGYAKMLLNPAFANPLLEDKVRLRDIHNYWRGSRARYFPEISANTGFTPSGPDDFLFSTDNLEWFGACRDLAIKQVKFFSDSTNLSSILPLSDQAVAVQVHLKFNKDVVSLPSAVKSWYPDPYRSVTALFRSTSAELTIDKIMQSAYALTNASITWTDDKNHPIGSKESGLRDGPFWDNDKFNFIAKHHQNVLIGIEAMIQSHFYNAHATEPSNFK